MGGNGRHRWFPFHRPRSATAATMSLHDLKIPSEFLCPISGFSMSDPVVVASGQTFERISVQVCRKLGFVPELDDGTRPDLSTVIPNLAMKSTILSWCDKYDKEHPRPPDHMYVEGLVRARMDAGSGNRVSEPEILPRSAEDSVADYEAVMEAIRARTRSSMSSSSSIESMPVGPSRLIPTRPVSVSVPSTFSSSLSEIFPGTETGIQNPSSFSFVDYSSSSPISPEEEEICNKLRSTDTFDHEQGLIQLRKMTRSSEDARVSLCTDLILSFLRPLIVSRYNLVQTNAAASLVNLSLEKTNKVKIVRSGFVPLLIDVLKSGTPEAQEHATGALFSLAIEDENKMVIGVLGALEPLLHALRSSESERSRQDAAVALYHLSLIPSNRSKLVRLGAVPKLLSMVRSGELASRILLLLCNIAACPEGKGAMLDGNAVAILVGKLREGACRSEAERENTMSTLLTLSQGNLRFKGLAREVGAEEVLKEAEEKGNEQLKEKAVKILQTMRGGEGGNGEAAEQSEWHRVQNASGLSRTQFDKGQNRVFAFSSQF